MCWRPNEEIQRYAKGVTKCLKNNILEHFLFSYRYLAKYCNICTNLYEDFCHVFLLSKEEQGYLQFTVGGTVVADSYSHC